jgi:sec-independent protein translocase protein TatC
MTNLVKAAWRVLTYPFSLIYKIIAYPFQAAGRFFKFLESDPEENAVKGVWDHVEDLRSHLLRTIIYIAAGVGISFSFTLRLMEYLARPVKGLTNLQAIEVTEEIGVFMRVALTSGITIAFPFIAFEIWRFAAPGLKPGERKFGLVGIPLAVLLFVTGVGFTFYTLIPAALPFLGGFTNISQFWTAKEYFGFITGLMMWIGLFFEFPLIVYVLTSIGFVKPSMLAQQWRLAVVIIAILAAAVTPTVDPANMSLVMVPMILLYFISIGLSKIAFAARRRKESAAETPARENQPQAG